MWIFLNNAMLSIVQHTDHPDYLLVRARFPGDIEAAFAGFTIGNVEHTPLRDYGYRVKLHRTLVESVIAKHVSNISYPNFKDSVDKRDCKRKRAYGQVWATMRVAQEDNEDRLRND